jgi:hypothetical protein
MKEKTVLYIHGMGGGGDSRIPSILRDIFAVPTSGGLKVNVIVRTYDFDPEVAGKQISSWRKELDPQLVIGESLGSIHAIRVEGIPHILVSPSLGAPSYLYRLSFLTMIPGVSSLCGMIWKPKEGDRQKLTFTHGILKKYRSHMEAALARTPKLNSRPDYFFAFFGRHDHYRRSGVVSVKLWRKLFLGHETSGGKGYPYDSGEYKIYNGTHFMEEEYIHSLLAPKIVEVLESTPDKEEPSLNR